MRTAFILFSFLAAIGLWATTYTPTEAYAVKFDTGGAEGTFRGLDGTIDFDPNNLAGANFDVWVKTATISTGNKTKDKHARGGSWLDAEAFPRITFKSRSFTKTAAGYDVAGQLGIHGVSKEVTIPFTFTDDVFAGGLTVVRQDYDISGPFLVGALVGDDISVELRIPVTE
jgi:polyisoprenoid-binding protein YceI